MTGKQEEEEAMAGDIGDDQAASTPETSPESVVRAYWERVWLGRDLDALDEVVADPLVRHTAEGTQVMARSDLRRRLSGAFEAVCASEVDFDALAVEGDSVWVRLTLRGVSLATAGPLSVAWLAQYRIDGGRIAELWALHQPGTDWSAPP